MLKSLKTILFKIARLPSSDQQWLINQLTLHQRLRFDKLNGLLLLEQANRFKRLPLDSSFKTIEPSEIWQKLAEKSPLYIAIILHQERFAWQSDFLAYYDNERQITSQLKKIKQFKPRLLNEVALSWQTSLKDNHD